MNPFEPPEIIDVPIHQPVKRLSAILTILIGTVILLGIFGHGVWRSYIAVGQEELQQPQRNRIQEAEEQ